MLSMQWSFTRLGQVFIEMNNHTYNIRWFIYLFKKRVAQIVFIKPKATWFICYAKKVSVLKAKRKRTRERMCFAFYALKDLYLLLLIKGARLKGS